MKALSTRSMSQFIHCSLIAVSIFAPFASHAADGANGGGGGGAILCAGQQPVLTDFYEAAVRDPNLVSNENSLLNQLRRMNEAQAIQYVARVFDEHHEYGPQSKPESSQLIQRFMLATREALAKPAGEPALFYFSGHTSGLAVLIKVDRTLQDPKDTGAIYGLLNCTEERVAVTKYEIGGGKSNGRQRLMITIRNPEVFNAMSPIDQISLIFGHELLQGLTQGRMGVAELESMTSTTSIEARRLNAWILLSSQAEKAAMKSFRPSGITNLVCSAMSSSSKREGWSVDRLHFRFYPSQQNTVVEILAYKDEMVSYPTYATTSLTSNLFVLPSGLDYNLGNDDVATSFDFKMRAIPAPQAKPAELSQNMPGRLNQPIAKTISFSSSRSGEAKVYLKNARTGRTEFEGTVMCYYRNPKDQEIFK